ncbi:MAG: circadian clock protein KaiA [Jaaginema sp. PMC 1079.18]|nr:circadian clock protein KaiA [Jaaginema sp. PMC 1080.18]MEC4852357.1 circadian clock protein KaiA [Jaaginema sp. PMC 1079.18]MEC4868871.1 circadian clock protein KaiA [Jaaginema sp. PMC 1078.18]
MSDYSLNVNPTDRNTFASELVLCVGLETESLVRTLESQLSQYTTSYISSAEELLVNLEQDQKQIDCLVIENRPSWVKVVEDLRQKGLFLPVVIIETAESESSQASFLYHAGEIHQRRDRLEQLSLAIERAISQFLQLIPPGIAPLSPTANSQETNFLLLQQRRLSDKLKERLGYLGVYYKRNAQDFFRHLSPQKQQELFEKLSLEYREIILNYFTDSEDINPLIDRFVNNAFFADFSVSQILEIHMELIDDFAQQLKLEGRSEEILLDYRLALIDIIAHLCEMYRRSIPREDSLLDPP